MTIVARERSKLGDLVETQKGFAFKSGWYCNKGRPIVKVSDFTQNSVDPFNLVCISEIIAADYLKYELDTDDVVVQTVGSWPSNPASVVGKCVRVPSSIAGALLNQNAVKLSPRDGLDRRFLFYLLRSNDFKTYIIGTAQGAASQAAITLEAIRGYAFERPAPQITELHGWFYVGADTETEARRLIQAARPDQIVHAVERVKNVEHVKNGEVRSLGVGDPYTGPLIPQ
jgi:type I restriction enzyme S subunit